jgi:hypothetical protein
MKFYGEDDFISFTGDDNMDWKYLLGAKVKAPFRGVSVEGVIAVRDTFSVSGERQFRYFVVNKDVTGHEFGFDVLEKDVTPDFDPRHAHPQDVLPTAPAPIVASDRITGSEEYKAMLAHKAKAEGV